MGPKWFVSWNTSRKEVLISDSITHVMKMNTKHSFVFFRHDFQLPRYYKTNGVRLFNIILYFLNSIYAKNRKAIHTIIFIFIYYYHYFDELLSIQMKPKMAIRYQDYKSSQLLLQLSTAITTITGWNQDLRDRERDRERGREREKNEPNFYNQ